MNPPTQPDSSDPTLTNVIESVRSRRAAGEALSDEQVLAAHPELAPLLADALRKLGMIQRARRLATSTPWNAADAAGHAPPLGRLSTDSIPGYELLREVHRGGQGVVYHARQISTRRHVAVKVMRQGIFADADDHRRFEREVHVLSALKHPNIVSIHDSGTADGLSYFVMNYVEGRPLDAFVAENDLDIDAILKLFVTICDAVAAAQIRGVIHRDLKPGNIRVDDDGEPHVLDFGLAKIDPAAARDGPRDAHLAEAMLLGSGNRAVNDFTRTGQFLGSLPWASPEQAHGPAANVDIRTDVYSIGVMLYQALTGRFPYPVNGSFSTVLDNILNTAPVRPGALRREINDEIETIILKCLQKDRERRYQGAGELSADLRRYLRGEPIDAKRDSHLYVLRKQLRRYRAPVIAALVVFASMIVGIVATTRATWRALRAEADALARAHTESRLLERTNWELYKSCLAAADAALAANDAAVARARLLAAPGDLRGWEWRFLNARLDQSLATVSVEGTVVERFALAPNGQTAYFAAKGGALKAIDIRSGASETVGEPLGIEITAIALSADGRRLAVAMQGGEIQVSETGHGRPLTQFRAHGGGWVGALAFSSDGSLIATGTWSAGNDNRIRVWDAATGELRGSLKFPESWITSLAFRSDGRVLASAHTKPNAGLRLWDLETQRETATAPYEGLDLTHVEFSPDGGLVAVASQESVIRLYNSETGHEVSALSGHTARVQYVAFSADGERLASVSTDQTVRVWDLATGSTLSCQRGHSGVMHQVAFLAEGDELLTFSASDGTLKRWDSTAANEPLTIDTGKYFVLHAGLSPDGSRVFTHQRSLNAATGEELERLAPRDGWDTNQWLVPATSLEWAMKDTTAALFRDGREILRIAEPLVFRPVVSPDGRLLGLGLKRGVLSVMRADDGGLLREIPIDVVHVAGAAFSHDAAKAVTWNGEGRWSVWDISTGAENVQQRHGTQQIVNAVFSRDDTLIATASYDGTARIWNLSSGEEIHVLRATGAPAGDLSVVWSIAFSPDGSRLAVGSKDRRIRIWDVPTGRELISLTGHAGTVMCLNWSSDGTQLVSGGYEGTVCVWDSLPRGERRGRMGWGDDESRK